MMNNNTAQISYVIDVMMMFDNLHLAVCVVFMATGAYLGSLEFVMLGF